MKKYLVTVEFRYSCVPKSDFYSNSTSKTTTIGVYDTFEEACLFGNRFLMNMESRFAIHKFPDGSEPKRDRFSEKGGCFGGRETLVSNLAYLSTPFDFYAKITTLKYDDIDESIDEVVNSVEEYKIYRANNEED